MSERKGYNTRPLKLITETLQDKGGAHMTAEEICDTLRSQGENVGLTTVYRNLDKLVASGEVKKFSGEGRACFGFAGSGCSHHFHLKCSGCGKLLHIECDHIERLAEHVKDHHGFCVDNTKTVLYGLCGDCAR